MKAKKLTENARELDDVVHGATETRGKRSEANGGRLTDDDPGGWRGTQGEEDGDDEAEGGLRETRGVALADRASDAEGNKEDGVGERAPEVDGAAAEVGGENPGEHDEDHLQGGGDEAEGEGKVGFHTGLCLETVSQVSCAMRVPWDMNGNLRVKKYTAWLAIRLPVRFWAR